MGPHSCVRGSRPGRHPGAGRRRRGRGRAPNPIFSAAPAASTTRGSTTRRSRPRNWPPRRPATASSARLIMGRARLERFRQAADRRASSTRRERISRAVDPRALDPRERIELQVGLGRAPLSRGALRSRGRAARARRGLVGDAGAGRARARARLVGHRARPPGAVAAARRSARLVYPRIIERMEQELRRDPASAPATYWLAASARAAGRSRSRVGGGLRRLDPRRARPRPRRRAPRRSRQAGHAGDHSRQGRAGPRRATGDRPPRRWPPSGKPSRRSGNLEIWKCGNVEIWKCPEISKLPDFHISKSRLRFLPVLADPDIDRQRHLQRHRGLHQLDGPPRRFRRRPPSAPRTAARRGR